MNNIDTQVTAETPAGILAVERDAIEERRKAEEAEAERVRKFLDTAMERWRQAADEESEIRRRAAEDLEFAFIEQWPKDIRAKREGKDGQPARPCLTINRVPQQTRRVTNVQRQQRPRPQVNPTGGGSELETAKIIQGMIRHIEARSDAEIAYDTGFEAMVHSSFGWWRILTRYVNDRSFDQELIIKRILNQFSVYMDPSATEPDRSDARWAFVWEDLSKDTYRAKYPKSSLSSPSLTDLTSIGDSPEGWVTKDGYRVAEYWHVEEEQSELVLLGLETGTVTKDISEVTPEEAPFALKRRPYQKKKLKWAKINAAEILEEQDWEGKYIPLIPVLGQELVVNGKRYLFSMVRDLRDPQSMLNFWTTAATEMVALAPKAPYVVATGQLEGFEPIWATANVETHAYLPYRAMDVNGALVPAPQRQFAEPPIQAIMAQIAVHENNIKAVSGVYDASLGAPGPESSGKAILLRQQQSDMGHLDFLDNMARSIRHSARVIIDLLPHIYDAPRMTRIVTDDKPDSFAFVYNSKRGPFVFYSEGPDGFAAWNEKTNRFDIPLQAPPPGAIKVPEGVSKIYDLSDAATYDVTVSTGPSYQTRRQEAVASMMALIQAYPQIMGIIGDLLVRQMDWPEAQAAAERLRRSLPPQLQDPPEGSAPSLEQLQAQIQVMSAQHEKLVAELNAASELIQSKKLELDQKERIENLKVEADLLIARGKIEADRAARLFDAKIAEIDQRMTMLREERAQDQSNIPPAGQGVNSGLESPAPRA